MNQETNFATPIASLFAYKKWANEELFTVLSELSPEVHTPGLQQAIRVLNHIFVVDCIFQAHLRSQPHCFASTNTKETPSVHELWANVQQVDSWYVEYASSLDAEELQEQLPFNFTDGDAGLMSRGEILMHVLTHGCYHRGAVGQMLKNISISPPKDIFSQYLHLAEPFRRGSCDQ